MSLTFTTDLAAVRALVRRCTKEAGLTEERAIDLVIAVSEVVANTVQHARSAGTLDIWYDANEIICQVTDAGFIGDPLAGARAPLPGASTGYGLWMVNQVCDKVDQHSDETGTTIRMHMNLKGLPRRRTRVAADLPGDAGPHHPARSGPPPGTARPRPRTDPGPAPTRPCCWPPPSRPRPRSVSMPVTSSSRCTTSGPGSSGTALTSSSPTTRPDWPPRYGYHAAAGLTAGGLNADQPGSRAS
jgi:anti-sigma regulatory factor (Ser/Thr protein kinase)